MLGTFHLTLSFLLHAEQIISRSAMASSSVLGKRKRVFAKDLKLMMYGFGDTNPVPESIDLMEDLVVEFIMDTTSRAMDLAGPRGKILKEDVMYLIRNDKKKLARVKELLAMDKVLKNARKAFDEDGFTKEEEG
mmetsp:Transcript_13739/g.23606  ORF Transcript_13739/g.23606 Transcript_13739/m.23606 type:complete len:134 (+) Transcript_13739:1-402(+)